MRCLCRAGYFWDSTAGACLTCAIGSFKNWVASSSSCPMSCPNETTSAVGAASVWECYCTGDAIDTNPQLDSFTCTDSMQLFGNSSETDHFAATEASVFSFNQTLRVTDASTETLVAEIRQQLSQFLELTLASRAYIELAVRLDTSWYVDLTVWSSERPIAHQLQNKFDPEPFAAWISSSAIGTALDSAQGVSRSEVEVVALQCPDGLGLRAGRYVRGMQDCQCPHGMQPSVSGSPGLEDGCTKCPLGSYKSSVGDVSCQPCPEPLTTTVDGAVAYSTCRYICTPGFYNNDPKVPTSCVECGVGGYCIDSIRTPCPPSESTVDATASSIGECLCASGSRFEIAEETADECLNCTAGKFKALVGCDTSAGFQAKVGLMTASGPFEQTTVCELGSNCTAEFFGVGLDIGDRLLFTFGACGTPGGLHGQGYPALREPLLLEQGTSLQVTLGELPLTANPGLFSMCWCVKTASCINETEFQAPAGQLQAGLTRYADDTCGTCPIGFYCPGSDGISIQCPPSSTTITQGKQKSDCVCVAGYSKNNIADDPWCEPCPRRKYKEFSGNSGCTLTCPAGSDSEEGSTSLSDCYCNPGFHADLDDLEQLEACKPCSSYTGLVCPGGFEENGNLSNGERVHVQPRAVSGYFQTGLSSAQECAVLLSNGTSTCGGGAACVAIRTFQPAPWGCHGTYGNACAEGASGMLCGECSEGWAREQYPQQCLRCFELSSLFLTGAILWEIFQKALFNFVVAAMAATAAVKGSTKLHTSMIRIASHGCDTQQEIKFPWPENVTAALREIFSVMNIAPQLASVDFQIQCHAEELLPGDQMGKNLAPAIYYISSPLLAMLMVILLCGFIAHVVIPLGHRYGLAFNNVAQAAQQKSKAVEKLKMAMEGHLLDYGLTWKDDSQILEDHSEGTLHHAAMEPDEFITGGLAFRKPLAVKMCLHFLEVDSLAAKLIAAAGLSWEEFAENPSFLVMELEAEDEGLQAGATGMKQSRRECLCGWILELLTNLLVRKLPERLLKTFVLRALVWKVMAKYKQPAGQFVEIELLANAVAKHQESVADFQKLAANKMLFDSSVRHCGRLLRAKMRDNEDVAEKQEADATEEEEELDPAILDFGLFTPRPGLLELIRLSQPVFWVLLLSMWPELLSKFLQMVWCAPISGDDGEGQLLVEMRLLPHPDVVCWSYDHLSMAVIATNLTFGVAVFLACLLGAFCLYFCLHIVRQLLRRPLDGPGDDSEDDVPEDEDKKKKAAPEPTPHKKSGLRRFVTSWAKAARSQILRMGPVFQRRTIAKALDEFTALWLDEIGESSLPVDTVQVLCALTSSVKGVPSKTPKKKLAAKWRQKVEDLLHHHHIFHKDDEEGAGHRANVWHFMPDEILDMTQRLGKLSVEDALFLVTGAQSALQAYRMRQAKTVIIRETPEEEEWTYDAPHANSCR
eukprot:g21827.t1